MAGKGDRDRRDHRKYAEGYDRIFNTCPKHPTYRAKRPPRGCPKCIEIYKRKLREIDG